MTPASQSFWSWLKSNKKRMKPKARSRSIKPSPRLNLERIEERVVPAFLIRVSDDGGATFVTAQDNVPASGPGTSSDLSPAAGSIAAFFSFPSISFMVTAAQSKPLFGNTATKAVINLNTSGTFATAGSIIVDVTDTDFNDPANPTGAGTLSSKLSDNNVPAGGVTGHQLVSYANGGTPGGNVAFGGIPGVSTSGNVYSTPVATPSNTPTTSLIANLIGPYSMSMRTVFTGSPNAGFSIVNEVNFIQTAPPPVAALGDFVWEDLNANGQQDSGEPGIPDVIVTLLDSAGNSTGVTTTTDVNGKYLFGNLTPGTYGVSFPTIAGYTRTLTDTGADATDSDASTANGKTGNYTLAAGETNLTVDAGYFKPATIGDFIWHDTNANGLQDGGETGVAGATVELFTAGNALVGTQTTVADGLYLFTNLTPGDYYVKVTPPAGGFFISPQDQGANDAIDSDANPATGVMATTTLVSGEDDRTWDAGLYQLASLGDFVWHDKNANGQQDALEPGIAGVTAKLFKDNVFTGVTALTDGSGLYKFSNLVPGNYSVQFVQPAGFTQVSPANVGSDLSDSDGDATLTTATTNLESGEYDPTLDQGFYNLAALGDFVWHDKNANGQQDGGEPGIPNVTVSLLKNNVLTGATTTTDANGIYAFTNLVPGNYSVQFTQPGGFTQVSPANVGSDVTDSDGDGTLTTAQVTLASGDNNITLDQGFYNLATIGDFIWEDLNANGKQDGGGEVGVAGATVQLFNSLNVQIGASQVTGANGLYLFTGLTPGDYYVKLTPPAGYFISPQDQGANDVIDSDANPATGVMATTTLISGEDDRTWDAGLYKLVNVGNFVWHDQDADGRQDVGEPGLPGVELKLTGTDGSGNAVSLTTLTDANGLYGFNNLKPGSYTVAVTPPGGYFASPTGVLVEIEFDSNTSPAPTSPGFLPGGTNDYTLDFGFYQKASLGDFVWHDLNANGIQDGGEPGIEGVTVNLKDAGGTVIATTVTNASGVYGFTNLVPGTYSVQFVQPAGYAGISAPNQGANDAVDSDGVPANMLMTATTTLASGQNDPTLDQGFYKLAALGDFVWEDLNADGDQDAGEPGIAGVTVTLLDAGGAAIGTKTTDANGFYLFDNLTPGTYSVSFPTVSGFTRTVANAGANDAKDSDASAVNGKTGSYTLASGQTDLTVDAGYVRITPGIDVEKTTDGTPNGNATDSDYDNEDAPNGPGVPILTPGTTVTWTYKVTNTGNVAFAASEIVLVDDNGTATTADDLSIANGAITFLSVQVGDADSILEPGEVWLYSASGTVQNLATPGSGGTVDFSGSSATSGTAGNIRTYTVGGVSVNVSGFSRDRTTGAWETAFLGAYGGGLGVTDTGEGSGANDTHTVDNLGGRDNYVLFEFSGNVVVDSAFLGYVVGDSDLTVWIGTLPDAFNNHAILSDAILASLGFTEVNLTDLTGARTADLNAGNVAGNVLVIAANTDDTSPEDRFKIEKLTVKQVLPGTYENKATVSAPGTPPDSDLSHYKNPTAKIDIEKYVKEVTVVGGEGLTPGYWKQTQHFPTWVPTGFTQGQSFNTVFGVSDPDSPTLLQALQTGGGGFNALGRHAVAALLNASHPTIEYKFTAAQVIAKVQGAYANPVLVESIKNELAAENERGADLNTNTGTATDPTPGNPGSDADVPQGLVLQTGESVLFTFIVTNPGAVALANVVVTDDNQTPNNTGDDFNPTPVLSAGFNVGDTDKDNQLDVGEAWKYTYGPIAVTEGQHTNNATVTGTPVGGGSSVTDNDPANWFGITDKDGTIKGKKYEDVSGNGLNVTAGPNSPADEPMGGVTIYLDADNDGVKDAGEQSTVTAADGSYQFTGLTPGNYIVREVVPAGYIRTNPTTTDYYAITVASGQVLAGYDFANAEKCDPNTITGQTFTIVHTDGTTEVVTDLRGNTQEGDVITVTFNVNVPAGQTHLVTFVSYTAPEPYFNANTAHLQEIFDLVQGEFGPGTHSLTVRVPNSYYQVDFVCGDAIDELGPAGSNIFYTPQMRLESADNGGTHAVGTNPGNLNGYKFLDKDADGVWDAGEPGLKDWTIYVDANNNNVKDSGELATVTDANGYYRFNNIPAGNYYIREVLKSGWFQSVAPAVPVAVAAGATVANQNFGNYQKVSVTGYKYNDRNADGEWDKDGLDNCLNTADDEKGLENWRIFVDLDGDEVWDANEPSDLTDANGYYSITGLTPGSYEIREVCQSGWVRTTDDANLTLASGQTASHTNVGNFKGNLVMDGDTATVNFWKGTNGQKLIKRVNGGGTNGTATALGNWLASNFSNMYGSGSGSNNMSGKTNAQVAAYLVSLANDSSKQLQAQVLATVLAVYVTDTDWAGGTYAASYGFNVSSTGVKNDYFNVGNSGAAFGVQNDSILTVWQILQATNARASNGVLWYGCSSTIKSQALSVFVGINGEGGI